MNSLIALLAVALPALTLANKVNVTVYYESLCPDSQRFINQQLYPAFTTPLVMYMTLTLVPYGNANTTESGFECQHGVGECYGNRVQACAISKETMPDKQLAFINCLMKMAYGAKNVNETKYKEFIKECGNKTDQVSAIETCADTPEMYFPLMYQYGNMTKKATPPIKGVPTTFFDDKSSKEINDAAMKDFSAQLCTYITGTKPNECSSGKGSASDIVGSIALVISALVLSRIH